MLEFILGMIALVLAISFASLNYWVYQCKNSIDNIALKNINQKEQD